MEEINNQNGSGNSNENQGSNENVNQNQEQAQSNNGTNQNQEQVQSNNGTNQNQVQPQQNSGVNQSQGQVQQNNNANQNQGQVKPNYNPNQNNNTKKKSKAPIIIVVVIIVLLLFGCVVLGVGIVGFKFITENKKGASNVIENLIDSNSNRNKSSSVNTNKNTNTNKNKNTNTNTNSYLNTNTNSNNNNTSTDITGQTTVTDAKTSSKENPLSTGTWGIASKYSTEDKKDEEVYVKVTKYVRGEEAKKAVQDYVNSSSFYKYEEPKEGLEWVVVDYDIDFANYKRSSLGSNARVSVFIKGTGNRSSVVYNGTTWILSSTYIGKSDYVKTQTAQGKVAFQMPIGCTDYILQFGEYNETNAFFKGE